MNAEAAKTGRTDSRRWSEVQAGAADVAPMLVGVVPFSFVTGVAAVSAGIPLLESASMNVIIFAGMSQIAASQLIAENAPLWVIVLTAWTINLRFLMYSAALGPHLRSVSLGWKALLAYMLSDQAFAVSIGRLTREQVPNREWYLLGALATLWIAWFGCATAGVYFGAQIPAWWSLDFAAPLSILCVALLAIHDRPALGAALTGAAVSVAALALPYKLGIVIGGFAGVAVGAALKRRRA